MADFVHLEDDVTNYLYISTLIPKRKLNYVIRCIIKKLISNYFVSMLSFKKIILNS